MPKTRARKKSSTAYTRQRIATVQGKNTGLANGTGVSGQAGVQTRSTGGTTLVGLIMPGMVALGCWGMAFTFTVFSNDPNRLLFGGMAA